MDPKTKAIIRYILLTIITVGAFVTINSAYILETSGKLTPSYAGIIAAYLGVWGYIVKWHYNTKISNEI